VADGLETRVEIHIRSSVVNESDAQTLCKGVSVDVDGVTGFDELFEEVGPRLWRSILAFTGGQRDLTDDVVAEAFLRTLASGNNVRDRESYVYRIAFRLAAQELARVSHSWQVPDVPFQHDHGLSELLDALRLLSPASGPRCTCATRSIFRSARSQTSWGHQQAPYGSICSAGDTSSR
jgi:hypothetical protein